MSSAVVQWDERGKPVRLANGRFADDGRCEDEPHAFPRGERAFRRFTQTIEASETCVSCGTVRRTVLSADGTFLRYEYRHRAPGHNNSLEAPE